MGVERAVTRWHVQYHMILQEIASLEAQLAQTVEASTEESKDAPSSADVLSKLQKAQERLRLLGPCPKPMMG